VRVPADIVTGYLGSGKTTFLRHVLKEGLCGQRVAVLVNDLAAVGVDGRVIAAAGLPSVETVVELDNGCICCSVDARFEYAVQDVVENLRPDLVLIEASGVADPRLLANKLEDTMVALDALITVVDCEGVERALATSEAARAQVEEADFLLLNKLDLVAAAEVDRLAATLGQRNPRALQLRTVQARIGSDIVFGSSVRRHRARAAGAERVAADADGMEALTCAASGELRRPAFERFLDRLPAAVYRAKGIVRFAGEHAPSLFNYVRGRRELQWLPVGSLPPGPSQGVFIGRELHALRARIEAGFRACG